MSLLNDLNIKKEEVIVNNIIDYESDFNWKNLEERTKNEMLDLTGYTLYASSSSAYDRGYELPLGYTYIIVPSSGSFSLSYYTNLNNGIRHSWNNTEPIKINIPAASNTAMYLHLGMAWRKK